VEQNKKIHEPRQKRSEDTIEKILDTAFELFCQNGYYKTSTNEIAKAANISIGNLYFYFPNKETIFLEILNRYHQSFLQIHEAFLSEIENSNGNLKKFLRRIIENIIRNHEDSRELNREIQILSFSNPKVRDVLEKQQGQIEKTVLDYLQKYKDKIQVHDIEAAAAIVFALINSVVDQIAFSKNKIDRERLLTETVSAVEAYLLRAPNK
jgi:AcrR family transcriptional regulator